MKPCGFQSLPSTIYGTEMVMIVKPYNARYVIHGCMPPVMDRVCVHCYFCLNQLTAKSQEVSPELTQSLKLVVENHATLHESLLKVSSKVEELNIQNTELKKRINQLSVETKLNELKQELTEQISKCHNTLTSKDKAKPSKSIPSTIVNTINEEKEREHRRLNLIIHNAPESTAESAGSRKENDIDCATDIFNVYLGAKTTVTKKL